MSATLGYPKVEIRHGLNGDHIGIAKYSSKNDPNYQIVSTELHKLVSKIAEEAEIQRTMAADTP
jgi:hypothetical protein